MTLHQLCYAVHRKFQVPVEVSGFKLENCVGSASLGYSLDLKRLEAENSYCCEYKPTNFPGLQYRYYKDDRRHGLPLVGAGRHIAVGVFATGKLIITGAHSFDELVQVFRVTEPFLAGYRQ